MVSSSLYYYYKITLMGRYRNNIKICVRKELLPFVGNRQTTLKRIASHLSTKWKQPNSRAYGYVNSRVAITLVRSTHCCIWVLWVLAHNISVHYLQ